MVEATEKMERSATQPETILRPTEKRVLELAARMELLCPRCGLPLGGDEMTEKGNYTGVVLMFGGVRLS